MAAAASERAEDVGDPAGRRVVRAGVEQVVARLVASRAAAEAPLVGDEARVGIHAGVVQRNVAIRALGDWKMFDSVKYVKNTENRQIEY